MLHPFCSEVNTITDFVQPRQRVWTFNIWKGWIFREQILQIKHAFNFWDRSYLIWIECVKTNIGINFKNFFGVTMLTFGPVCLSSFCSLPWRRKYTSSLAAISWYTAEVQFLLFRGVWGLHLSLMLKRCRNSDDVIWYSMTWYGEWLTKYSGQSVSVSVLVGKAVVIDWI